MERDHRNPVVNTGLQRKPIEQNFARLYSILRGDGKVPVSIALKVASEFYSSKLELKNY